MTAWQPPLGSLYRPRLCPAQRGEVSFPHCPCTTTTTTSDGLVEVVCQTRFVGRRNRHSKQTVGPNNNTSMDGSGESPAAAPSPVEENCFQYVITLRNLGQRTDDAATCEGPSQSSDLSPKNKPKKTKAKPQQRTKEPDCGTCRPEDGYQGGGGYDVVLLSRHWLFYDVDNGAATEVCGPGVLGEFPCLSSGESHTYSSGMAMRGSIGFYAWHAPIGRPATQRQQR